MIYSRKMDTDKLVFGIIGGITLLITIVIIATSFSTTSSGDLKAEGLIGSDPHRKGPENARLTVVEFSDFECPYCAQYVPIISGLVAQYPDNLAFIYRHYPLPSHAGALPAARASEAAAKQGKFWEYHDELFANQPDFAQSELELYAQNVGLNVDQFKADYASSDSINKVQEDADYGRVLNIGGTPTFYLLYDGKVEKLDLQKYSDLESKIKEILGESSSSEAANENPQSADVGTDDPADLPAKLSRAVALDVANVQRKGTVNPNEVSVFLIEEAQWPDASLGCPKEGQSYAQVVTPGYIVMAKANGEAFEYHLNESADSVVFCEATVAVE